MFSTNGRHASARRALDAAAILFKASPAALSSPERGLGFTVGEQVRLLVKHGNRPFAPGPFMVMARRTSDQGDVQYRIKSSFEAFERVAKEGDLSRVREAVGS